jgi:hypothetical protein
MKKHFILFLFIACSSFVYSQTFIREIIPNPSPPIAGFMKAIEYPDGHVLFGTAVKSSYPYSTLLVMLNSIGDTTWTREIDSVWLVNNYQKGMISPTSEGGCIILGRAYNDDFFQLTRLDAMGNHLWTKDYQVNSNTDLDTLIGVVQTKDSGFTFMGRTTIPWGNSGFSFVKINSMGDTLWTRKYITYDDEIIDFAEAPDSGFYFIGSNGSSGTLAKTDRDGYVLWRKKYSLSAGIICFREISTIRIDTILIEASQYSYTAKNGLVELSASGAILNSTETDINSSPISSFLCDDGRVAISQNAGKLCLLDQNLNLIWRKKYIVNSWMSMYGSMLDVTQKSDGNFWIFGKYDDGNNYGTSFFNTDSLGYAPCFTFTDASFTHTPYSLVVDTLPIWQEEKYPFTIHSRFPVHSRSVSITELCNVSKNEINETESLFLYPNPASSQLTIDNKSAEGWVQPGGQYVIKQISIYNMIGEKILSMDQANDSKVQNVNLDVSGFRPGVYFVSIETEKGIVTQKLIKQ